MELKIKDFKWTREPENSQIGKDRVEIITQPGTDLWQRTYCQTAHYGRCEPHFDFGRNTSPIVPYRYLTQIISGITADCRSLV